MYMKMAKTKKLGMPDAEYAKQQQMYGKMAVSEAQMEAKRQMKTASYLVNWAEKRKWKDSFSISNNSITWWPNVYHMLTNVKAKLFFGVDPVERVIRKDMKRLSNVIANHVTNYVKLLANIWLTCCF